MDRTVFTGNDDENANLTEDAAGALAQPVSRDKKRLGQNVEIVTTAPPITSFPRQR